VRRYVEVLAALGVARDVELDDALVHEVGRRVQVRALPEPSTERVLLMEHRHRLEQWLTRKKPLRLTKAHVLLRRDHGLQVSYATLRRFAIDELGCLRRRGARVRRRACTTSGRSRSGRGPAGGVTVDRVLRPRASSPTDTRFTFGNNSVTFMQHDARKTHR
jgi:hypothetical protein